VRAGALPNLALVSAVQPKDIGVTPAVDRTLADLGYADTTSNAPGLTTEEFFFTMPQGQKAGADAYLNLLFTHSTLLEYDRSGVVIRLNSQPIGSIRFSDESALEGETRINLPATTVRPGLNRIAIDVDLVPRTVCVDPNLNRLWMRVDAGSSIHVPFAPADASLQPILDLTLYPSPFTLSPLFSGLAFVVAPNDPAGWRTAAKIAYDYGNRVGTGFNTLALAYGDAVSDDLKQSRDFIIIGRPSTLPIVSELGDSLPAPFEAGNDLAIERNLQVAYHLLPGVNVGYVELLAAPWNSKRAVLLVAGSTETGLDWAGTALITPALRSQLSGNFAAINGTQVVSSDTRIGGLQSALALKLEREQALGAKRSEYDDLTAKLRASDERRLQLERELDPLRQRITDFQLKEQAARLGFEQYTQLLADAQADLEAVGKSVQEGNVRLAGLQNEIDRLHREIAALGAVNLAALEELTTASERKQFLDAQSADLNEAITTLEDAIRKIDGETRELLAGTFQTVNEHFGKMFPELFGGGNARLVMTGDEILDAGVQVLAQPPGKKNQTIHLLSGGEKALTAIALVFAIFQLNPAPFCLLDEVDAPLDDANTERYAKLVTSMSRETQFLFISHNKIAMEMAEQLIGVTMQEQGVSRIVAVDMESAVSMAEAA